jgi:hypothetical protein
VILQPRAIAELQSGRTARRTFPRREGRGEPLRVGFSYAVHVRTDGPEVCRVRVLTAEPGMLHEVTDDEARAEGFRSSFHLFDAWWERYREGPGHRNEGHWPEQFVEVPVWVITLGLHREHTPRLLHRDSSRGYTRNPHLAMTDEPEAVGQEWLEGFALDANGGESARRRRQARAEEAERRSIEQRLARATAEARLRGVDVSKDLRVIQMRVQAIETRLAA